jgi:benzodiazapine receptor
MGKQLAFRLILFLVLNFGALAIGGLFTGRGVASDWYQNLNKAPWTPPGWVFGMAWFTIMLCYSVYLAWAWEKVDSIKLFVLLYALQWILNVSWNPLFFHFQLVGVGLIVISGLTLLIGFLIIAYIKQARTLTLLLAPYFIWLLIATSLNAYILFRN